MHTPGEAVPDYRELALLAELLSAPRRESLEILNDTAAVFSWLREPVDELKDIPLENWQAEHTRLFINGYPGTPCPPFQYAFQHGGMDAAATEEITQLYLDAGLSPTPDVPPDYLGTILQFGGWCLQQGKNGLWDRLYDNHIRDWIGEYAEALQREAELKLYMALSERLSMITVRQGCEH